jgi:hypothetical protein
MDIRDILKSFDQLTEGESTVHKAGPGGYGNKHGSEDVTDQYGKPIGRRNLAKMDDKPPVKRGKGRPPKAADSSGEVKKYDSSALSKAMGVGKAPKPTGKPSVKHSLKEYFSQLDDALNEAGLAVQPMPATPAVKAQQQLATKPSFMIKDPANPNMPAITTQDPAVVDAAKKGTMTMQKPGAAPTAPGTTPGAKPATGAGSQVAPMEEDGENWIKGAIKHPGAFTKKASSHGMTPKEFANKVLAHKKDYPAKTEKQAQLAKTLGKMHEAETPPTAFQSSPLSTNNRGVLEGKKGVNPFAKKDDKTAKKDNKAEMIGKKVTKTIEKVKEGAKPDFPDIDDDNNTTEPISKAAQDAKKTKKKVKEGMEHHLQAARLEGKSHALRKMPYNCTHDNMEEARCYHDGFKEGLDECYGQMPILGRTAVDEVSPEVDTMASYGADELGETHPALRQAKNVLNRQAKENPGRGFGKDNDTAKKSLTLRGLIKHGMVDQNGKFVRFPNDSDGEIDEMDKTSYMKQQSIKTPGNTFKAFGQTMNDKDVIDEFAFEALDKQLNAILEGKDVTEGMTVSISKGQQGSPDSVSVSAQDGEADQLLSIIKSAGMGLFGGEEQGFNAPQGSAGAHGGISVVDDHDGMMALMKKLSGGAETSSGDFADEEGHEGHGKEGHSHEEEDSCNECGMAYESCGCDHGDEQVVDEVESRDQMAYEVAEDNPPDSGAAETDADDASEAGEDAALAKDDAAQDEEEGQVYSSPTNEAEDEDDEDDEKDFFHNPNVPADQQLKAPPKEVNVAESFSNLYKKLALLSEESTSEKDDKAEKAGKKVKKDIEYDDKKDKKKIDEWANEAGKNGTDASFETDIDFMTKVISGGLNKQKSTGQTTIPVIAGQKNRMGADGLGKPMKESTDLLKDYRKLSGL